MQKLLPSKKIPLNINSILNDNYSNNINNIREVYLNFNELRKDNELSDENKEIYNFPSRKPFNSDNLNNEYMQKNYKDNKPGITNEIKKISNPYSRNLPINFDIALKQQ